MEKLYKLADRAEKEWKAAWKEWGRLEAVPHSTSYNIDLELAKHDATHKAAYHEGIMHAIEAAGLLEDYYQHRRNNK